MITGSATQEKWLTEMGEAAHGIAAERIASLKLSPEKISAIDRDLHERILDHIRKLETKS